jgi:hypothetical protein
VPTESSRIVQTHRDIPDVHLYCDDWCDYCPVTARCVAFRVRQRWEAERGPWAQPTMDDLIAQTREVAAAAGRPTPGLDAMLAGDPKREFQPAEADEWLVTAASQYAAGAEFLLKRLGWNKPAPQGFAHPPSAHDVLAGYSLFIAARAGRAVVAAARADRGIPGEREDAEGCAKICLMAIDRSRAALKRLPAARYGRIVRHLLGILDTLAGGLETRIPGARAYVRAGLDAPIV